MELGCRRVPFRSCVFLFFFFERELYSFEDTKTMLG